MTWRIRDHGFQMTLSREVPQLIRTHLTPWLSAWLARHGLSKEQIGSWAVHPGGPAILQGVQAALNLTRDDLRSSWEVLAECGNMSSPTILFVLERLRARAVPRPCVALGFGPGLAVEAQLFTD
jgi:predicted naringenin-chalcone synthase